MSNPREQNEEAIREPTNREAPAGADLREPTNGEDVSREPTNRESMREPTNEG